MFFFFGGKKKIKVLYFKIVFLETVIFKCFYGNVKVFFIFSVKEFKSDCLNKKVFFLKEKVFVKMRLLFFVGN